jgi:hypothetical protein
VLIACPWQAPLVLMRDSFDDFSYQYATIGACAVSTNGTMPEQAIVEHFETDEVEYQQIHTASLGCFDSTVRRV